MTVALSIENLRKHFGGFEALRGVSLNVEPGELVALLGPSGSGKTTLLRLVAGLEVEDAGRILFGDVEANNLTLRDRRIGFVFQHYALFRHLTVEDNIAYGLRARPRRERPSVAEIRSRVGTLLDLVQLGGLEKRFPAQLSGGQRQRVALARALAIEPRVLLLDEPFGALDAQVRKDLRRWLRDLHARTGHTTLFVTHDQDEALELADRVAILNQGAIEQVGTSDDVYERPETSFVCGFLGETNRLPVEFAGGQVFLGELPIYGMAHFNTPGPGSLYVRPHDLQVTEGGTGALSGIVLSVRRIADRRRASIAVPGMPAAIETDISSGFAPAVGERIGLRIMRALTFDEAR
ncbi:MAG: sulfate/molybdate ABC transporter ATP-binding protein [Hyphomicrobiales bacterium]|nr:sulfate/molybdate ABC transporter ATP-binding protein [Hyphomicrobiales bacterium]OQW85573.1 MAG: sulfate ABC transporter ATP-binding protein [Proteobacteria bacterium ST_bin15]